MSSPLYERAAHWMALLESGSATDADRQAFEQWLVADPQHHQVFDRLQRQLHTLQGSPLGRIGEQRLIHTVTAPSGRRRFLRNTAGLLGLATAGIIASRFDEQGLIRPGDLYTDTGERRHMALPDSSDLTLDARSRATPTFGAQTRQLYLRHGQMLLRVRQDSRLFCVQTPWGQALTSDATLQLAHSDQGSRLVVLASTVLLAGMDGQRREVPAGHSARFDRDGLLSVEPTREGETSWLEGRLTVHDRPLGEVVDSLRPYRRGIIQITAKAERQRATGIYPLDDTDLALRVLEKSLGLQVTHFTPYWVRIDKV